MLGQRRRRYTKIKPAVAQRIVHAVQFIYSLASEGGMASRSVSGRGIL